MDEINKQQEGHARGERVGDVTNARPVDLVGARAFAFGNQHSQRGRRRKEKGGGDNRHQ